MPALRVCCVNSIEQNLGPHIEQKWATLAPSAGSVWLWYARAVGPVEFRKKGELYVTR